MDEDTPYLWHLWLQPIAEGQTDERGKANAPPAQEFHIRDMRLANGLTYKCQRSHSTRKGADPREGHFFVQSWHKQTNGQRAKSTGNIGGAITRKE